MTIQQVCQAVETYQCRHICVTGGEPLSQKPCFNLLTILCDLGYEVSLETSGAIAINSVDPRVVKVMDLKTPNSGEMLRNLEQNIPFLNSADQVKFVICNLRDYDWSVAKVDDFQLSQRCTVLFSPAYGLQDPAELANWILQDKLGVRMQLQLHKILWGDKRGV